MTGAFLGERVPDPSFQISNWNFSGFGELKKIGYYLFMLEKIMEVGLKLSMTSVPFFLSKAFIW